jgi:hypothetical protein
MNNAGYAPFFSCRADLAGDGVKRSDDLVVLVHMFRAYDPNKGGFPAVRGFQRVAAAFADTSCAGPSTKVVGTGKVPRTNRILPLDGFQRGFRPSRWRA